LATFWVADSAPSLEAVTEGQDQALAAANKAIALAPDLADGYIARSFMRTSVQWEWDGAKADAERGLSLKPDDAEALSTYAYGILRSIGDFPRAIDCLRKAAELDPLNASVWGRLGNVLALNGQYVAAREAFNRSLEISPEQSFTPYNLGLTFLLDGQPAAAKAISARSTNEVFRLAGVALAEHDLGRGDESQRALDELVARFPHSGAYQIAQVYARRGDKERALGWLERARSQRDGGLAIAKVDPVLRPLRGEARFAALLQSINLPLD
jgi:tetratricopeptide (TPR) repeat protein